MFYTNERPEWLFLLRFILNHVYNGCLLRFTFTNVYSVAFFAVFYIRSLFVRSTTLVPSGVKPLRPTPSPPSDVVKPMRQSSTPPPLPTEVGNKIPCTVRHCDPCCILHRLCNLSFCVHFQWLLSV